MESRYGKEDVDVQRLQSELAALVASKDAASVNHVVPVRQRLDLQSKVKQHFHSTESVDLQDMKSTREPTNHPSP
jgi:hypothetical protein